MQSTIIRAIFYFYFFENQVDITQIMILNQYLRNHMTSNCIFENKADTVKKWYLYQYIIVQEKPAKKITIKFIIYFLRRIKKKDVKI